MRLLADGMEIRHMINWERVSELREEVGAEDFDEVVELFLTEVDEEIGALSEDTPRDGLAEKLHFLKGSALSLGFTEFSGLCQTVETALTKDPASSFDLQGLHAIYATSRSTFLNDLPNQFSD